MGNPSVEAELCSLHNAFLVANGSQSSNKTFLALHSSFSHCLLVRSAARLVGSVQEVFRLISDSTRKGHGRGFDAGDEDLLDMLDGCHRRVLRDCRSYIWQGIHNRHSAAEDNETLSAGTSRPSYRLNEAASEALKAERLHGCLVESHRAEGSGDTPTRALLVILSLIFVECHEDINCVLVDVTIAHPSRKQSHCALLWTLRQLCVLFNSERTKAPHPRAGAGFRRFAGRHGGGRPWS